MTVEHQLIYYFYRINPVHSCGGLGATVSGPFTIMRVTSYVDGFNLYHSVVDIGINHYKWLDLWKLSEIYAPKPNFTLTAVYYFSALAHWLPGPCSRHQIYIEALKATGVTPILGNFKEKDRSCNRCGKTWKSHEEKETDVNLAIHLLSGAYDNTYDTAFVISGDSDLSQAIKLVLDKFPHKQIKVIIPPGLQLTSQIRTSVGGINNCRQMKEIHLERSLLPATINTGTAVINRPHDYDPP